MEFHFPSTHLGVRAEQRLDDAHVLVWIPTCASTFQVANYNLTKAHTAKLAVLDESDPGAGAPGRLALERVAAHARRHPRRVLCGGRQGHAWCTATPCTFPSVHC